MSCGFLGVFMSWLKNRALEPSTWRGVGALLVALGIGNAGVVEAVVIVGLSVISLVEMVRAEK